MDTHERRENESDTCERMKVRRFIAEAVASYEQAGKKETLARIADPEGPFIQGERYVFALDVEGNLLAHPFSKQLVGRNLTDLRDSEGRNFILELLIAAQTKGHGFVDYNWRLPHSKKELHKTVFFERVDGLVFCSGFYTSKENPLEVIARYFIPYGPC